MLTPSASTLKSWLPRCVALTSKPGEQLSPVCIYIYSIIESCQKEQPYIGYNFCVCVCVLLLWGRNALLNINHFKITGQQKPLS